MSFDDAALIAELPTLRRIASIWREAVEPEDLVQDTCLLALLGRRHFDGSNLQAWLMQIMKLRRFSLLKQQHGREARHALIRYLRGSGEHIGVDPNQEDRILVRELQAAIDRSTMAGAPMLMPAALGYDGSELGEIFGVPIHKVRSALFRARVGLEDFERIGELTFNSRSHR